MINTRRSVARADDTSEVSTASVSCGAVDSGRRVQRDRRRHDLGSRSRRRTELLPAAQHQVGPHALGVDPVDQGLRTDPGSGELPGQLHPPGQQRIQVAVGLRDEGRIHRHPEQDQHGGQDDDHRRGDPQPQGHRVQRRLGHADVPSR